LWIIEIHVVENRKGALKEIAESVAPPMDQILSFKGITRRVIEDNLDYMVKDKLPHTIFQLMTTINP